MLEAIAQLPPANKDTLAFLILHLQRVAASCDANKMPLSSLAKIFGPAIVGHASSNPKDDVILADTKKQPVVLMKLLGISSDYWKQYMSESDNPEPSTAVSPTPSVRSSPGLRSPATPELRPGQHNAWEMLGKCLYISIAIKDQISFQKFPFSFSSRKPISWFLPVAKEDLQISTFAQVRVVHVVITHVL